MKLSRQGDREDLGGVGEGEKKAQNIQYVNNFFNIYNEKQIS